MKKDLDLSQMQDAVLAFRRAQTSGGLGLFFYAGHGVQVKGENFLVPVGAKIREEFEVKRQCLEVGYILDAMAESEARLKVVILDSCRDNPFARSWSRSTSRSGLAAMTDVPEGTVIAFSTTPGKTADDGRGSNSPYTANLVAALRSRPSGGLELTELFREASCAVKRETGQVPWLNLEASLDRYFLWTGTATAPLPIVPSVPNLVPAPAPSLALEGSQAGQLRSDNGLNMELVWCPAGSFTMGVRDIDKEPVAVTLSQGFWLGKFEVTQGQWQQVMGSTPWKGEPFVKEGSDYPATCVCWDDSDSTDDIREFCRKLTDSERNAARLPATWKYDVPTEAQWEYACRAGSATRFSFSFGEDENALGHYAWYIHNADLVDEKYAHRVGQKLANAWGLHDMHGNVWEWCRDLYQYKLPGGRDPEGLTGEYRAFRGGAWCEYGTQCRTAYRNAFSPGYRKDKLVLCHFCCDGWYPLGRRSRKTDLPGRVSWRSDIE